MFMHWNLVYALELAVCLKAVNMTSGMFEELSTALPWQQRQHGLLCTNPVRTS